MTFFSHLLSTELAERIGWTLLHSLWQFAMLAIVTAGMFAVLRRKSADLRYLVGCFALAAMLAVGVTTFCLLPAETTSSEQPIAVAIESPTASDPASTAEAVSPATVGVASEYRDNEVLLSLRERNPESESPHAEREEHASLGLLGTIGEALSPWLPWITILWIGGVILLSLRNLLGWIGVQRLRRVGTAPVCQELADRARALVARMKISRPVRVLQSTLVEIPIVAGWIAPVILLPASILGGLSTAQLEAILAHELAHIRRHDYLVNLLQTVAETLLFYHPAVWWLSRRIRTEREHCCDDAAVRVCGDRLRLGEALTAIAAARLNIRPALAASGNRPSGVLHRVRRLLDPTPESVGLSKSWAAVIVLLVLGFALTMNWSRPATAEDDAEPSAASKASTDDAPAEKQYTLSQIIAEISKRDTKYSAERFRIEYRRTVNDMEGKGPRTEYDTLTAQWHSYREEARQKPDGKVLTTLLKLYDQRASIDPYAIFAEPQGDRNQKKDGSRLLRFNAHNVGHSVEGTLGRQLLGTSAWQVKYWRECDKAGNLRIERRTVDGIPCVVVSAGGFEMALAPRFDWAPIRYGKAEPADSRVVAKDFHKYGGFWIPSQIEYINHMMISVEPYIENDRDILEIRSVKTGDAAGFAWRAGAPPPFALPMPRPGDQVEVAYEGWDPAWDNKPVDAGDVRDYVRFEHRFRWQEPLPPYDASRWMMSQYWCNGLRMRLAVSPDEAPEQVGNWYNAPLPFSSPNDRRIVWAVYDIAQKRLKRLDLLPDKETIQENGISAEAGFSAGKSPVEIGKPMEVTFFVKNTGERPIYLVTGLDSRSVRSYRFRFAGINAEGFPVADPYDNVDYAGGMSGPPPEIKPGETYRETVRLDKWLKFDRPGEYRIYAGRTLQFGRDGKLDSLQGPYRLVHPLHTAFRLQVKQSDKPNKAQESTWGKAVEGVQCRLRPEKSTWEVGHTPPILADLRNRGQHTVSMGLVPSQWKIQYDGVSYQYNPKVLSYGGWIGLSLKPGDQRDDISLQLQNCSDWKSEEGNRPLEFTVGKHTLRAVFHRIAQDARTLQVESNTVEVEIAAANSPRRTEGRVTDADGRPIVGALLEWGHYTDPPEKRQRTTTDEQGRYRLEYRKYSIGYRLGVSSPGKAPQWKLFYQSLGERLRDGKAIPPAHIDFKLASEHRIEGIVVDEQGKPIPQVRIRVQTAREYGRGTFGNGDVPSMPIPGEGTFEATTASDGRFRIDGLPAKEVQLSLTAPFRVRDPANYPVDQECRIAMGGSGRPGVVRGRVVDAETGKPVEEFRVVGNSDPRSRLVASADGRFVWDKKLIEGDTYTMYFYGKGYAPAEAAMKIFPLDGGGETVVKLSRGATFLGRLVDARSGKPIAHVTVMSAMLAKDCEYFEWGWWSKYVDGFAFPVTMVQRSVTDDDGNFWFSEATDKSLAVFAVLAPGYARQIVWSKNLPKKDQSGRVAIRLDPEASVSGVLLTNGRPLAGVAVLISHGREDGISEQFNNEAAITDSQGRYRFGNLGPDAYSVSYAFWPSGGASWNILCPIEGAKLHVGEKKVFKPHEITVPTSFVEEVTNDGPESPQATKTPAPHVSIEMKPRDVKPAATTLRGQVLDHEGKPVENARVFFRGPGELRVGNGQINSGDVGHDAPVTDKNGRFVISDGGKELKRIVVIGPHRRAWIVPAPKAGSEEELTIRLPQPATLKIIVDLPGASQGNEQIMVRDMVREPAKGLHVETVSPGVLHFNLELKTWEMEGWKDAGTFFYFGASRNPGEVVFKDLTPGTYDFSRTKMLCLGDRGQGAMCDRQLAVRLLPGETKTIRLVRKRGQRVGGEIHGLPADVPGVFITVRPATASGEPHKADEWKLPEYDALTCQNDKRFLTGLLEPGRYRIVAEGYRPEPRTGVIDLGWRMPDFVGTAVVTVEDDDPANPKKPTPHVSIEMKPRDEKPAGKDHPKAKPASFADRPMPDLTKLAARSRPSKDFGNPDATESFYDILKLRDAGDQKAVPVLTDILISNAGAGRIHGYAAAQALFCIGGKEALNALGKHLFRLDEYNERLTSMYVFHWDMPEPKRSQFLQQYVLKTIGRDIELALDAKPEDGGRSVRFRLKFKNVSAGPLDVLTPNIARPFLRSADGRFLRCQDFGPDEYDLFAKWVHLKPNEQNTVEAVGKITLAKDFEPYERKAAKGAEAMLKIEGTRYFIDKLAPFQAVFVLEQTPIAAQQKDRLKLANPWVGRAVSAPVTIDLGKGATRRAIQPGARTAALTEKIDPAEVRRKIAALAMPDDTAPSDQQPPNWLGVRRERIVPELIAGLNDKNPKVAEGCLYLLKYASPSKEVTAGLVAKAGDEKSPLRYEILCQLEKSAADPRVARLLDAASVQADSSFEPLARARWAMLAGHKDRAVEILKPLLQKIERYALPIDEIRLLGEIGEPGSAALLEPIASGDNWYLAVEAHKALAKIDPKRHGLTKDQASFLEEQDGFKESQEDFRRRMADLAKLNAKEVRPFVMQMLCDKNNMDQQGALVILAAWKDKEALPQIRRLMQQNVHSYCGREAVAAYLSIDDSPQTRQDVLDLLSEHEPLVNNEILGGIVTAAIPTDHRVSMLGMAAAKLKTPYSVPEVIRYQVLRNEDLREWLVPLMDRETNLHALAIYCDLAAADKEKRFGPQVRRAMKLFLDEPTVSAGGEHTASITAIAGAHILAAVAVYDLKDLASDVKKLMASKNPAIHTAAQAAGAKLGIPGAINDLLARLGDQNATVRQLAAARLLDIKPLDETERAACEEAILTHLGKPSEDFAMRTLVNFGREKAAKALQPILDDPNAKRALHAAWVLAQLPDKAAVNKALRRVAIFGLFNHWSYQQGEGIDFDIAPGLRFHQATFFLNPTPNDHSREGPVRIPNDLLRSFTWDDGEQRFAVRSYQLAESDEDATGYYFPPVHFLYVVSMGMRLPINWDATQLPVLKEIAAHDLHIKRLMVKGQPVAHFEHRQRAAKAIAAITKQKATYRGLAGETLDSEAFPEPYKDQNELLAKFFLERIEKAQLADKPQSDRRWQRLDFYRANAAFLREQFGPPVLDVIRQEAKQRGIDLKDILPPEAPDQT